MGNKKRRVWAYSGSLIKPAYRYLLNADFQLNPKDQKGSKLGKYIFEQTQKMPLFHFQPLFKSNINLESNYIYSYVDLKFLTEWQQRIYLNSIDFDIFYQTMQKLNEEIELIRNLQGNNDEYPDEIDYLK